MRMIHMFAHVYIYTCAYIHMHTLGELNLHALLGQAAYTCSPHGNPIGITTHETLLDRDNHMNHEFQNPTCRSRQAGIAARTNVIESIGASCKGI